MRVGELTYPAPRQVDALADHLIGQVAVAVLAEMPVLGLQHFEQLPAGREHGFERRVRRQAAVELVGPGRNQARAVFVAETCRPVDQRTGVGEPDVRQPFRDASRRVEQQQLREDPFLERIQELGQLQKTDRMGTISLYLSIELDVAKVHVEVAELLAPRDVATRLGDQTAVVATAAATPFGERPVTNGQPNPCDREHAAVVPMAGPKHDLDGSARRDLSFECARRRNPAKAAAQLRRQPLSGAIDDLAGSIRLCELRRRRHRRQDGASTGGIDRSRADARFERRGRTRPHDARAEPSNALPSDAAAEEAARACRANRATRRDAAQWPSAPYVGMWSRIANFHREALERELASGAVVKATVMRQTLHLVTRRDYGVFRAAMSETNFPWETAHRRIRRRHVERGEGSGRARAVREAVALGARRARAGSRSAGGVHLRRSPKMTTAVPGTQPSCRRQWRAAP